MKKLFAVLVAIFLLAVIACSGGGGDGGGNSNTSGQNKVVLAPNATQVNSETGGNLSSVSDDGATLTFSASTSQLNALKKDDVIVSGVTTAAPRGLLKKVVSVSKLPDGTVQVMTTPAALTDAFKELHISGTITGVSNESSVNKGIKLIEKALNISGSTNMPDISSSIPFTSFSESGSYNSSFTGNYKYTPDFIYEIDISNFHLNKYKLALKGDQTFNLDGVCSFEGAVSFSPEKSLADIPVAIIDVGPVVFTIEVIPSVGVEISAEKKFDINAGFTSSISMTAGFEYINGTTSSISSYSGSFTPYYTISDQVTFSLRPYFRAKVGFYVYGAAGPYMDVQPYGKFAYVTTPNPHLDSSYGIEGNAGGEVKVYDWTIASLSLQLFDINIPFAESAYNISGRITDSSGTPLSGVTIALSGKSTASVKTDAAGYYKFTNLSNGSYTVTPSLSGYSFNPSSEPVVVYSGDAIVPHITDAIVTASSAKAITAFSLNGVLGTINETGKTIAVVMPFGTAVTNLVATFTTTGANVKVGSTVQASGSTANNFTSPVVYKVTAADATTQNYMVTVTVTTAGTYSMSGTIHIGSNSGAVISGATVSIAGQTYTTGSTGTFTITGIPTGTYVFSVSKSGYDTYTNSAYYVGSDQTGLNFYLTAIIPSCAGTGPVDMGAATNFGVLVGPAGGATFTVTNPTSVTGDTGAAAYIPAIGVSNLTGTQYTGSDAPYVAAKAAMLTAIGCASGRACTVNYAAGAIDFGSMTLAPGVHCVIGAMSVGSNLTISTPGVYIFRSSGVLDTAANVNVTFGSGVNASNTWLFWVPSGAATISAGTAFKGTIMPNLSAASTMNATATLLGGRLFSNSAVNVDTNTITIP